MTICETVKDSNFRHLQFLKSLQRLSLLHLAFEAMQGKLNGRQCVAIEPPKHLHVPGVASGS